MIVRPARGEDAAAVCEIWNAVIRGSEATFTTEEKTETGMAARIRADPFFVAVEDGALAGFVTCAPFRSGPGYARTLEHSIHIAPSHHGRGMGRALMERLERAVPDAGSLIAAISAANPGAAVFHARIGFAEVGRIPQAGWKNGRWLDLVLMQKLLAPATRQAPDNGEARR
jgi:phosphinothricin acetyltransferase